MQCFRHCLDPLLEGFYVNFGGYWFSLVCFAIVMDFLFDMSTQQVLLGKSSFASFGCAYLIIDVLRYVIFDTIYKFNHLE